MMVATATALLSVEEAKGHLRVDIDDDDQEIETAIKAAVAYVEKRIGAVLIDQAIKVQVNPTEADESIRIATAPASRMIYIAANYWTEEQARVGEPLGALIVGRDILFRIVDGALIIGKPEAGWPERKKNTPIEITLNYITSEAQTPANIKQAVIMLTREYYEGRTEFMDNHPINTLLNVSYPSRCTF